MTTGRRRRGIPAARTGDAEKKIKRPAHRAAIYKGHGHIRRCYSILIGSQRSGNAQRPSRADAARKCAPDSPTLGRPMLRRNDQDLARSTLVTSRRMRAGADTRTTFLRPPLFVQVHNAERVGDAARARGEYATNGRPFSLPNVLARGAGAFLRAAPSSSPPPRPPPLLSPRPCSRRIP